MTKSIWHKINWEKANKSLMPLLQESTEDEIEACLYLIAKTAGEKLTDNGCLPEDFIWENGLNCGFPKKTGKYIVEIKDDSDFDDGFYMAEYDNEYDFPCFTVFPDTSTYSHIIKPVRWTEIP